MVTDYSFELYRWMKTSHFLIRLSCWQPPGNPSRSPLTGNSLSASRRLYPRNRRPSRPPFLSLERQPVQKRNETKQNRINIGMQSKHHWLKRPYKNSQSPSECHTDSPISTATDGLTATSTMSSSSGTTVTSMASPFTAAAASPFTIEFRWLFFRAFLQLTTNRSSSQRVSISSSSKSSSTTSPVNAGSLFLFCTICSTFSIFSSGKFSISTLSFCFSSSSISLLFGSRALGLGLLPPPPILGGACTGTETTGSCGGGGKSGCIGGSSCWRCCSNHETASLYIPSNEARRLPAYLCTWWSGGLYRSALLKVSRTSPANASCEGYRPAVRFCLTVPRSMGLRMMAR
uniref:Uncharacterized protein n=1 Tax=Zea mays TaxID=4577 RepID=A0A804NMF7_MAIZE